MCVVKMVTMISHVGVPVGVENVQPPAEHVRGGGGGIVLENVSVITA